MSPEFEKFIMEKINLLFKIMKYLIIFWVIWVVFCYLAVYVFKIF